MFAVVAKYSVFPVQEYYTDIQKKNFLRVVSDLWIDFECFEAAELKNELSFSLSRQDYLQNHNFCTEMLSIVTPFKWLSQQWKYF